MYGDIGVVFMRLLNIQLWLKEAGVLGYGERELAFYRFRWLVGW